MAEGEPGGHSVGEPGNDSVPNTVSPPPPPPESTQTTTCCCIDCIDKPRRPPRPTNKCTRVDGLITLWIIVWLTLFCFAIYLIASRQPTIDKCHTRTAFDRRKCFNDDSTAAIYALGFCLLFVSVAMVFIPCLLAACCQKRLQCIDGVPQPPCGYWIGYWVAIVVFFLSMFSAVYCAQFIEYCRPKDEECNQYDHNNLQGYTAGMIFGIICVVLSSVAWCHNCDKLITFYPDP